MCNLFAMMFKFGRLSEFMLDQTKSWRFAQPYLRKSCVRNSLAMLKFGRFIEFELGERKIPPLEFILVFVGCSDALALVVQLGSLCDSKDA